jgi:hypothetical protein
MIAFHFLAAQGIFKVFQSAAEARSQLGQTLRAKYKKNNKKH